jgi:hypothetical protein
MASTDDDEIDRLLLKIGAERTGKTPSKKNNYQIISEICQPLNNLFDNFTPNDWLKIRRKNDVVSPTVNWFWDIFLEHLPECGNSLSSVCGECIAYLIQRINYHINKRFVCDIFKDACCLYMSFYMSYTAIIKSSTFPISCKNYHQVQKCDKIVENCAFISAYLDIIPKIFLKFYEYLSDITTTYTFTKKTIYEGHIIFESYDNYFCQKRCAGKSRRCCNEAVSEGGMCEKHMPDPLTKPARKC